MIVDDAVGANRGARASVRPLAHSANGASREGRVMLRGTSSRYSGCLQRVRYCRCRPYFRLVADFVQANVPLPKRQSAWRSSARVGKQCWYGSAKGRGSVTARASVRIVQQHGSS